MQLRLQNLKKKKRKVFQPFSGQSGSDSGRGNKSPSSSPFVSQHDLQLEKENEIKRLEKLLKEDSVPNDIQQV